MVTQIFFRSWLRRLSGRKGPIRKNTYLNGSVFSKSNLIHSRANALLVKDLFQPETQEDVTDFHR